MSDDFLGHTPTKHTHTHSKLQRVLTDLTVCHRSVSWPPPRDLTPQESKQSWRNTPQSSNSLGTHEDMGCVWVFVLVESHRSVWRRTVIEMWTGKAGVCVNWLWGPCVGDSGLIRTSHTEGRADEDVSITSSDLQTAPCPLWHFESSEY